MIQRLHHGLISLVEWDGFLRRNRLVTRERLPDVSRERSVKRFEQLQEEHEDLVPVGQQLIAAGMRNLFDQTFWPATSTGHNAGSRVYSRRQRAPAPAKHEDAIPPW